MKRFDEETMPLENATTVRACFSSKKLDRFGRGDKAVHVRKTF